ncbi:MAG: PIG-L family deacetylase [Leptolyngbya sp. DLM2.Bin27]|nr:MAG: PIG-L family deacetylase [Leptolyngbya sp. DLM2.Bin27]
MVVSGLSPLGDPQAVPLRSQLPQAPVLVVAPHPDDETLGCGGAIAALRAQNQPVSVLVVSDGTRSHPRSQQYPAPRLRQVREAETLSALALLGVAADQVTFWRLPDGSVPALRDSPSPPEADAQAALALGQRYLPQVAPRTIFLPYRYDPHRDHRAAWSLIQGAIAALDQPPRQIEYPIWDWDPEQRQPLAARYQPWRLDITPYVALKRQAIHCYRSQTTDLIADDPTGFRLSPALIANFLNPWEFFLEPLP